MKADTFIVTYARTLLEVADEKGELEGVREEAEFFTHLETDPRLRVFLESPRIEKGAKLKLLETVFLGRTTATLYKFVLLVVKNGRGGSLQEILEMFLVLYDEKMGLVKADITTAVPLAEELQSQLREALETKLAKTIELRPAVDEDILGGMVVRFSGMVADSSLKTALDRIEDNMLSLRLGSELVHED